MRTFFPRKTISVAASAPHPEGTIYKISVGDEDWGDGTYQSVVKVQIEYDGKVAGRKSPSYPVGTDDWKRVAEAIRQLADGYGETKDDEHLVPTILSKESIMTELEEIICLTEDKPSSEKTKYLNVHTNFISENMEGIFSTMIYRLADDLKLLCDFKQTEGLETCNAVIARLKELDSDSDFDFPYHEIVAVNNIIDLVNGREKETAK